MASRKNNKSGKGSKGRGKGQRPKPNASKRKPPATRAKSQRDGPPAERASAGPPVSTALLAVGAIALLIACAASFMLVFTALTDVSLPGCGPESACGRATNSVWGKIPGLGWPTSHVGLAYFLALLVAWLGARGRWPAWLCWVVRVGAAGSIALVIVMVVGGYVCAYCMTVHAASLAFLAVMELAHGSRTDAPAPPRAAGAFGATVVVATVALLVAQVMSNAAADRRAAEEEALATQRVIDQSPTGMGPEVGPPAPGSPELGPPDPGAAEMGPVAGFTGRYRIGPEAAPIRVVIISDYQCPDCKRIEGELREILAERDDVSFSAKQFPFCRDCNRIAREKNYSPHANACWAARAAETAGILGGEDGFWRMHHWLFDRGGSFTDAEIRAALPELGFDPHTFLSNMQQAESLRRVHADIEEAAYLGLRMTPMIFINGVEFTGWGGRGALGRAIERVAATNPPVLTAAADRPPPALEKYVNDWRKQRRRQIAPGDGGWTLGPPTAPAEIVVWGDYQEPFTAELDGRFRAIVASRPDARYAFRHYPMDQACNDEASRTRHPEACRAAAAAEAAGRLGGNEAYWAMHAWLMANQSSFGDDAFVAAAGDIGLDPSAFLTMMDAPEVADAIRADAAAGKAMGLRGVPFTFVNGKRIVAWRLEGEPLVETIVEEAAQGR